MPPRQSRTSRKMKREQGPMQVLLAYDGSAGADQAAAFVLARSWPTGATIHVVAVLEPSTALVPAIPLAPVRLVSSPELEGELEAHLRQQVDAVIQRLRAADLTADGAVLIGRPAVVLTEEAGRLAADLIVVGSRGHGPISSLLLGSVSAEVVDHAKAPVLVARGADAERVLLASDGSSAARRAEQLVEQWPTFDGATIRVLSVAEITRAWHTGLAPTMHAQVLEAYAQDREAAKAAHQAIAEDAASRLGQAGRSVDARVRIGDAAGEIVEEAAAWPADLVVLGSRGLTGLPRVVLGSVARNVLQGSHGSVLIVPYAKSAPRSTSTRTPRMRRPVERRRECSRGVHLRSRGSSDRPRTVLRKPARVAGHPSPLEEVPVMEKHAVQSFERTPTWPLTREAWDRLIEDVAQLRAELVLMTGQGLEEGIVRLPVAVGARRLETLKDVLDRCTVVEDRERAVIGRNVVLRDGNGGAMHYRIGFPGDGDPDQGCISADSPLGMAVLGARPGDVVRVEAPAGPWTATVIEVH